LHADADPGLAVCILDSLYSVYLKTRDLLTIS
jgi:hypothetical protein